MAQFLTVSATPVVHPFVDHDIFPSERSGAAGIADCCVFCSVRQVQVAKIKLKTRQYFRKLQRRHGESVLAAENYADPSASD